jgi:hypothetical protein
MPIIEIHRPILQAQQSGSSILGYFHVELWENVTNLSALTQLIVCKDPPERLKNVIFLNAELVWNPFYCDSGLVVQRRVI